MVDPPLAFVFGNLVFGRGSDDPWALFRLATHTYAYLPREEQKRRFLALLGAVLAAEADLQLLRVGCRLAVPAAGPGGPLLRAYANQQRQAIARLAPHGPLLFMAVRLTDPTGDLGDALSRVVRALGEGGGSLHPRALLERLRRGLAPSLLPLRRLQELRERADALHLRLASQLAVRPAKGVEVQWLVRRGFCRGLGEPPVVGRGAPAYLQAEINGSAALIPLEGQLLRWRDGLIEEHPNRLAVVGERGLSHQAHLVVGALPERLQFPSPRAELLFRAAESLPFPIDIAVAASFIPNGLALRLARRGIQDADQLVRAEEEGEQGVTDRSFARSEEARELLAYLQGPERPPLLRASLAVAVGAAEERELERRVEAVRRAFGEVHLYRPLGEQLRLFCHHLPGRAGPLRGYDDLLTVEQLAALMPTATHRAGSRRGFPLGVALAGCARPVRLDLAEGSLTNRNAAILCVGALGSGKTTTVQKLLYEAYLSGARVVDCDPKGDHRLPELPELAKDVERLELRPDPQLRGLLDPLLVAPDHLRQETALAFLEELLPADCPPSWQAALVRAVGAVVERSANPTCSAVLAALSAGDPEEAALARTLAVYAEGGLTQLAFAPEDGRRRPLGTAQFSYVQIRDLPAPEPGVARGELSRLERIGQQLVRLIALFAFSLLRQERGRLKVFAFDEGWRLLGDPVGRNLLLSLQRLGRSELAVPIISTQLLTDALVGERESLAGLLGATLVFGLRSQEEADRALALLGLDRDRPELRRLLLSFGEGRCLLRDHRGRIEAVQVLLTGRLLERLTTGAGKACR